MAREINGERDGAHDIVSGYCGITGDGLYGLSCFYYTLSFIILFYLSYLSLFYFIVLPVTFSLRESFVIVYPSRLARRHSISIRFNTF